jgi:uncharacterized protein
VTTHLIDNSSHSHLDTLSVEECLARIATQRVGRLAVVVDHYPQVFCVNYRLDDFVVVFRTHIGSTLLDANHANVGFEVDYLDHDEHRGWSVLIQGMAEDVTDRAKDATADRSRQLDIAPWPPGDKPRVLRVIPARITGREIVSGDEVWATDSRGYV